MSLGVDHIQGTTFHARHGQVENAFRYGVDYLCLDAEADTKLPVLFSRNARNLTSLWDKDHGGDVGDGSGAQWVRQVLAKNNLEVTGRILLVAQPRVLGHVFNPVSFWLIYDTEEVLRVVIAEVSNTFGDRHSYLCHHDTLSEIKRDDSLHARKIFHVSPFQPVEGDYTFRFDIRSDRIGIWIDYRTEQGGVYATLIGHRRPLTTLGLIGACLRRPLGSRRVLTLIHWQALKLWWKGAKSRARPAPPTEEISR